jgi:hypothetical protein
VGYVQYAPNNPKACDELTMDQMEPPVEKKGMFKIFLAERGDCTFV